MGSSAWTPVDEKASAWTPVEDNKPPAPPDSFMGGMVRRGVAAVKGLTALNPTPITSQDTIANHPIQAAMDAVPGLTTVANFTKGQYQGSKEALHQAVDQLHDAWTSKGDAVTKVLQYARAGTSGLSALDPFATGSVTNVNNLSDQGRMGEAAGQGATDALILGAGSATARRPLISTATSAVSKTVQSGAQEVAQRLYQSALKPSLAANTAEGIKSIVNTGLENKISVSEAGEAKLSGLINDLNDSIKEQLKTNPNATVNPNKVAGRVDQLKPQFANQVNAGQDLASLEKAKQQFLTEQGATPGKPGIAASPTGLLDANGRPVMGPSVPPTAAKPAPPMAATAAQDMKVGTYQQLKAKYGELSNATDEAQKALARGLKEELENQFPEIGKMNAKEAQFIGLDQEMLRAVKRIGNREVLGGPTFMLKHMLDSPAIKSKLAIALNHAGVPLPQALSRVSAFTDALAQNQQQPQQ